MKNNDHKMTQIIKAHIKESMGIQLQKMCIFIFPEVSI